MKKLFAKDRDSMTEKRIDDQMPMFVATASWRTFSAGALLAVLMFGAWFAAPGRAHMRGMYATKAEAEKRAAELNCKGAFQMESLWMPCANERVLHDVLQKTP